MTEYDRRAAAAEQAAYLDAVLGRRRARADRPSSSIAPELIERQWLVGSAHRCDLRLSRDPVVAAEHAILVLRTDGSASVEALPEGLGHTRILRSAGRVEPVGTTPAVIERGDTVIMGRSTLPWRR